MKKFAFKLPFKKQKTDLDLDREVKKLDERQKKLAKEKERVVKSFSKPKPVKKKHKKLKNRQILRRYLNRAGFEDLDEDRVVKNMFRVAVVACLVLSVAALSFAAYYKPGEGKTLLFLAGIWTGVFAGLVVLTWIIVYIFLDIKVFNRTKAIEDVLPDYLQLASANISAGMPIDRALWFAVRPRFGILAKEIEDVAKNTFSGEDLKVALEKFTSRYDSIVLKRSMNLLIEGMESGGELAELLNKIALNIQETKLMKQEMAASVMTYAIFIGFATIVAAPVLYGLSAQLLDIIQKIMGIMAANSPEGGVSGMSFAIDTSSEAISKGDFRIFSFTTLFMTSMFSGFIISIIRKGTIKEGMRFIPVMVLATMGLYLLATWILGMLLGGIVDL